MSLLRTVVALVLLLAALATPAQAERLTVSIEGESGTDIILIPGLASSPAVWDGLAAQLRGRHRVHRLQVAGFAGSPAAAEAHEPVVAGLAEAIAVYIRDRGLRAPAIVGHSLGGEAALMVAARHPGLVGKVMTVDALPFYSLLLNPAATPETVRPQAEAMRAMLATQSPDQARAGAAATMTRMIRTEAARPAAVEWAAASDPATVASAVHELMTTDLRPELGRIAAPLTVVYAYDPAYGIPAERIDALFRTAYAEAPAARFERIDDSFHFVMLDQPEAFAAAVARFLAEPQ